MSKELKAKVTLDVQSATKKLDLLAKKINAIDKAVNKTSTNSGKMSKQLSKVVSTTNQWAKATKNVQKNVEKTSSALDEAGKKLKGFLAAFTGVMMLRVIVDTSDTITSAENRLNAMNGNNKNATQEAMDKMYGAAQRSRTGYADMLANVSKSMTLAPDAFQGNIDNAIRFQEIMGKTYALGGASAAEQSSSMYQLIQGLGSGILQGDELRSVREGAPLAYQAIEEYAQGIFGAEENLKDLASQGKITSDIVVAAMMQMGTKVDEQFANTAMTFAQAGQMLKNDATKAFEPVLQQLNALLNSDAGQAAIQGVSNALVILAHVFGVVVNAASGLFNFIYENWSWIQWIVYAISAAILFMLVAITAHMVAKAAIWIWSVISTYSTFLLWILVIGLIIAALVVLTNTTGSLCEAIVQIVLWVAQIIIAVLAAVFLVYLATGTLMLSIPVLIALVIIGILALLIAAFLTWTRQILGFAYGLGSSIGWIFENIGTIWSNILNSMIAEFWAFVGACLNSIKPLVEVFNGIAGIFGGKGIDIDGAINSVVAKEQAANSKKVDLSGGLSNAWSTGYAKGAAVGTNIQNKIDGFGNKIKEMDLMDSIAKSLKTDLPDPNNPAGGSYDPSKVAKNIGDTADNTGKMADSMELADEELELLRKMAEMEWKKEYTTANFKLDVTNNNSINSAMDIGDIASSLTNLIAEDIDSMANGVYPYAYAR